MFRKTLLAIGLLAYCVAAHGKKPEPMPSFVEPSLPVEIVMTQQELGVDVSNTGAAVTAAAVGGILGALIGSAITRTQVANAEKRVGEIRNLLVDYDFNARFEAALRQTLAEARLSPDLQVSVVGIQGHVADLQAKGAPSQPNVLVVAPRYAVAASFESLTVRMTVTLVERTRKSNGKIKQAWKLNRTYAFSFPMQKLPGSDATEDAARWTGMGAATLHALLDQGIEQVNAMLAYDLSDEGRADALLKNRGRVEFNGNDYLGRKLRGDEESLWVRSGAKYFLAIQGYRPLTLDFVAQATEAAKAVPLVAAVEPVVEPVVEPMIAPAPEAAVAADPAAEAEVAADPAAETEPAATAETAVESE